jgi:hypothetical protein
MARYGRAMRDPEKLERLYIAEFDERKLMIQQMSGSVGFNVTIVGLLIATVIAGSYNATVFFSLLGASIFVALIRLVLKLYYRVKF